ncbi:uncharacterized protein LOC124539609 [Vanessa cardui]|uniref:uncharacterized protein LOC124539609 n=1 Tax=Vanessa cardui TaxID=171605 RepID=UPI001F132FD5|nr:uncharacterized protein LOC124539609 [Vanessa cardui]
MTSCTTPKFASNPDLPTNDVEVLDDSFINVRKRKLPHDDIDLRIKALEQKFENQLTILSSKINKTISESVSASLKTTIASEFSKISSSLDIINTAIAGLRTDNASLKESFKSLTNQFLEVDKSICAVDQRQDLLDKKLNTIESQISLTSNLPGYIQKLENKLAAMEQQARECNIEIVNVPDKRNENLINIMMRLGSVINQQILASDIVAVHRVPHADQKDSRPKNIIVKFTSRMLRDNVLALSRSVKGLNADQLGISGSTQKVYVNEHLTLENKRLFRECRERAKKHEHRFVWTKHGVILVRKSETSPVLAIRSKHDMAKINDRNREATSRHDGGGVLVAVLRSLRSALCVLSAPSAATPMHLPPIIDHLLIELRTGKCRYMGGGMPNGMEIC